MKVFYCSTIFAPETTRFKRLEIAWAVFEDLQFLKMDVSHDSKYQLSTMLKKRIKTRTWYVEFRLEVTEVPHAPDFDITQRIKQRLDASDQERIIKTLRHFAREVVEF